MANEGMEKVYTAEESIRDLLSKNVVYCRDFEDHPVVMVRNSVPSAYEQSYKNDVLSTRLNRIFKTEDGQQISYHVVFCNRSDDVSLTQFETIYEYLFRKISDPISGSELQKLVNTLEDFFKVVKEKEMKAFQIGVYGELLVLLYFKKLGWSRALADYHIDFSAKHDFEIGPKNRLEVKTCVGLARMHQFSHTQLVRSDVNVHIVSVSIEISKEGTSLHDLFQEAFALNDANDPEIYLALKTIYKKCGLSSGDCGIKTSREQSEASIRVFKSMDLPHLDLPKIPRGVSDIHYKVDCNFGDALDLGAFIVFLNSIVPDSKEE